MATSKSTAQDPRVAILKGEARKLHEQRENAPSPAAKASLTRAYMRVFDGLVALGADVSDVPSIESRKRAGLISSEAQAILAALEQAA